VQKNCAAAVKCAAVLKNVKEIAAVWQLLTNAQLPPFVQPDYAENRSWVCCCSRICTTECAIDRSAELPKNVQLPRPAQPNAAEFAVDMERATALGF
jgi:hypothetical protein